MGGRNRLRPLLSATCFNLCYTHTRNASVTLDTAPSVLGTSLNPFMNVTLLRLKVQKLWGNCALSPDTEIRSSLKQQRNKMH